MVRQPCTIVYTDALLSICIIIIYITPFLHYNCNIYIIATSALDFKQLYIIYKFYLIKRIFLIWKDLAQIFKWLSQI